METSYFNLIVSIGLTGEQEEREGEITPRMVLPGAPIPPSPSDATVMDICGKFRRNSSTK